MTWLKRNSLKENCKQLMGGIDLTDVFAGMILISAVLYIAVELIDRFVGDKE